MITLGFGMMLYTVAHNWIELTGGSDGLPLLAVPPLRLFGLELSLFEPATMYFSVLVVCSAGVLVPLASGALTFRPDAHGHAGKQGAALFCRSRCSAGPPWRPL